MRSLNLDQLRAFVEVVERGSFTAAATELNLTQPAGNLDGRDQEGCVALAAFDAFVETWGVK